jgi:hypothetical protein
MNGTRHCQSIVSVDVCARTSQADPDPRMKPIDAPTVDELPMRPRRPGAAISVV